MSAFTVQNNVQKQQQQQLHRQDKRGIFLPHKMVSDEVVSANKQSIVDKNNVEFIEGCIIQTCVEIRAYQVARKAYGSFDGDDKSFVPLEGDVDDISSVPRKDCCLVLPEGIRGHVTRVYDIDEFDASSPILVKFQVDEGLGSEYIPPVTFLMHFQRNEVEVVQK